MGHDSHKPTTFKIKTHMLFLDKAGATDPNITNNNLSLRFQTPSRMKINTKMSTWTRFLKSQMTI